MPDKECQKTLPTVLIFNPSAHGLSDVREALPARRELGLVVVAPPGHLDAERHGPGVREIIGALVQLRTEIMELHARELDLYARRASATNIAGEEGDAIKRGFERVIAAMESVLAKLEKAETFTEIIERMRVLIKLNDDVRKATLKKHEAALREIFGPEEKPEEKDDK